MAGHHCNSKYEIHIEREREQLLHKYWGLPEKSVNTTCDSCSMPFLPAHVTCNQDIPDQPVDNFLIPTRSQITQFSPGYFTVKRFLVCR